MSDMAIETRIQAIQLVPGIWIWRYRESLLPPSHLSGRNIPRSLGIVQSGILESILEWIELTPPLVLDPREIRLRFVGGGEVYN
jgi:hypothetical protein